MIKIKNGFTIPDSCPNEPASQQLIKLFFRMWKDVGIELAVTLVEESVQYSQSRRGRPLLQPEAPGICVVFL
eukprot:471828-Pyramimonas_sp.AAC.1